MKYSIYQVDAFAEQAFTGNPAAVIPLKEWLPTETMQNIALENNLSETAFFIPTDDGYSIRWFTPGAEVDLCGHATLASAHVLFRHMGYERDEISFDSRSGILKVVQSGDLLVLDFPSSDLEEVEIPEFLQKAFNKMPIQCLKGRDDLMLVFQNESEILELTPDFQKILEAKTRGIICTAPSANFDFVSRFFAPAVGINEDPVTGSAHTMLIPYWADRLERNKLLAKQVSPRGGILHCEYLTDRVKIAGKAISYMIGEIFI